MTDHDTDAGVKQDTGGDAPHVSLTITAAGKPGRFLAVATNGVGEVARDTFELNSATGRRRFLTATLAKVLPDAKDARRPALLADLEKQLLAAAAVPPGEPVAPPAAAADPDPRVEQLAKTPEDVRAEAVALLESPDLVRRVSEAIAAVGVVGEAATGLTLYLVGTSAQLPRPVAAIVRGSSSSGKTYTIEQTSSLFPPEVVLRATSLTTNALFYFPPGTLRHRWVVCGERSRLEDDDRAEATRALREMIESGRLSKAVPAKDDTGAIVTKLIEQEGPIAFTESTTLGQIFDEDANRCLLLPTDESRRQTQAVIQATARRAAGGDDPARDRLVSVFHALHRMIPRTDVVIPFAPAVADLYPPGQVDSRRSFRHLLGLVKASALLHFRQRARDGEGRIVATVADYAVAERLGRTPLADAASGVSAATREYMRELRAKFGGESFVTTDAQKVGAGSRATRYRRLLELHNAGAVEQTEPPKGRVPASWKLTDTDLDTTGLVLPSAESVAAAVA